jgi:hypothetical protein
MPIDWKKIAIAAIAAFLLSILTGIVRGVSFLPLFLRAVLFAVLAGGLVQGFVLVVRRFLPELSEEETQSIQDEEESGSGQNIDIVLPAEDGTALAARIAAPSEKRMSDEELEGELAEEVEEIKANPIVTQDPGRSPSSSLMAARPPDLLDDVDVLPDLDGFSDAFAGPIRAGSAEADEGSSPEVSMSPIFSGSSKKEGPGANMDPAVVAAAMRTLLKRDLKG